MTVGVLPAGDDDDVRGDIVMTGSGGKNARDVELAPASPLKKESSTANTSTSMSTQNPMHL